MTQALWPESPTPGSVMPHVPGASTQHCLFLHHMEIYVPRILRAPVSKATGGMPGGKQPVCLGQANWQQGLRLSVFSGTTRASTLGGVPTGLKAMLMARAAAIMLATGSELWMANPTRGNNGAQTPICSMTLRGEGTAVAVRQRGSISLA